MRIQIKERNALVDNKIDSYKTQIENVVIKEDLLNPDKERLTIYFRGPSASGVLHLRLQEVKDLINTVKPYTDLVKRKKT